MTMLIRRTSPSGDHLAFRQVVRPSFASSFSRAWNDAWATESPTMPVDVRVTPEAVQIEAALPGVKPEDVAIDLDGRTLTITASEPGEGRADDDGTTYREIRRGRSVRTVRLPEGLRTDGATAHLEHGLLTLSIPKADEAKPRRIALTTAPTEAAKPTKPASASAPVAKSARAKAA